MKMAYVFPYVCCLLWCGYFTDLTSFKRVFWIPVSPSKREDKAKHLSLKVLGFKGFTSSDSQNKT